MKKLLLTLIISLMSLTMSAQNVSYANLMKLAKMTSVSSISNTLRSWGYKLGHTQSDDDSEIYQWGWGNTKYEEDLGDWVSSGSRWGIFTYIKYHNGGGIIYFGFPSSATYNQIKAQIKANGWKLTKEEAKAVGFKATYKKSNTLNYITLVESTSEAGGYVFLYAWYE